MQCGFEMKLFILQWSFLTWRAAVPCSCGSRTLSHRVRLSVRHCLQDSESKSLSGWSGWIGKERPIDRGQRHLGTVLSEQHLAGAHANSAVFRKLCQTKGAKKLSALGIGFKRRQRDMKQRVIRDEN